MCCEIGPVAVIVFGCLLIVQGVFALFTVYVPGMFAGLLIWEAWLIAVLSIITGLLGLISGGIACGQRTSAVNRALAYFHLIFSVLLLVALVGCFAYSAYLVNRFCIDYSGTAQSVSCLLLWIGWGCTAVCFLIISIIHTSAIASRWACRIGMAYEKI